MRKTEKELILNTYRWIKVKKFVDDESLSWEERFKALEKHHIEETTFLINKIREIVNQDDTHEKLEVEMDALGELEHKTFWTFENDEPVMKTVVLFSDVVKSINDRQNTIFASKLIHALIKTFS